MEINSCAQLIEYTHESLHFRTRVAYNFLHTKSWFAYTSLHFRYKPLGTNTLYDVETFFQIVSYTWFWGILMLMLPF